MAMKEIAPGNNEEKIIALSPADEDMLVFEQKQRKRKKKVGVVLGIIGSLIAVAAVIVGGTYFSGLGKYNNGQYDEAKAEFEKFSFISLFDEMTKICDYSKGCELLEAGDKAAAYEIFSSLGSYNGADEVAAELCYSAAMENYSNGNYNEAWEAFVRLGDYKDSAEFTLKARYAYADQLFAQAQYEDAKEIFANLGDYEDSPERVMECRINHGIALYRQEKYDAAFEVLDPFYFENELAEAYCILCRFQDDRRAAGIGFNQILSYYYELQRFSDLEDFKGLTEDPMFHIFRFFDATWSDGNGFVIKATKDDTIEVFVEMTNQPWLMFEIEGDNMDQAFTVRQDDALYVHIGSYNWFRVVSFSSYDNFEPEWVIIEDMGGNPYTLYREK